MTTPEVSEDIRYPIGKFDRSTIGPANRAEFIQIISDLPNNIGAAVNDLNDQQLDTPYRPGGWTVRQTVHHVADSHMNAFVRFRLGLTEQNPTIKPYDEKAWSELPDMRLPIDVSLRLIEALHERWVHLLRSVPASAFQRQIFHPEHGPMTLDAMVSLYSWHGRHHTAHIAGLRHRQGWH